MATDLKVSTESHTFACGENHGVLVKWSEKNHQGSESGRFESGHGNDHRVAMVVAKGEFQE